MPFRRMTVALLLTLAATAPAAGQGKPARCATTDDGAYACRFVPTDRTGSFEISAPGKPTYALEIDTPGVAFGFVTIEGRSVALPGRFLRRPDARACWRNDVTAAQICAW